jgi:hypothetical protein
VSTLLCRISFVFSLANIPLCCISGEDLFCLFKLTERSVGSRYIESSEAIRVIHFYMIEADNKHVTASSTSCSNLSYKLSASLLHFSAIHLYNQTTKATLQ